jgi:hypothetical protein
MEAKAVDAEACYLGFEIDYQTTADKAASPKPSTSCATIA